MSGIVGKIAWGAALFSALAAGFSAWMAYKSWRFNQESIRPRISITEVKTRGKRIKQDQFSVQIRFFLGNKGEDGAIVDQLLSGLVDFKQNKFFPFEETTALNVIGPGLYFAKNIFFDIEIDPSTPDDKVLDVLPKSMSKTGIIIIARYYGESSFKNKVRFLKYYMIYEGSKEPRQMRKEEYEEIEPILPEAYKRNAVQ